MFFELMFSQKQRRHFFYRCLYQLPFTCGERCEKKTVIFFINWNRNSLQIAKFNVFFVICRNATNILISFENSSFDIYFSNIVSIVVVVFNSPFNRNAFFSGLKCLLRTSFFCFKSFKLIPLNVFVYLGIQAYFCR